MSLCGKDFFGISRSHLKIHGKTYDEFIKEYPEFKSKTDMFNKRNSWNHLSEVEKYIGDKTYNKRLQKYQMV